MDTLSNKPYAKNRIIGIDITNLLTCLPEISRPKIEQLLRHEGFRETNPNVYGKMVWEAPKSLWCHSKKQPEWSLGISMYSMIARKVENALENNPEYHGAFF